MILQGILNAATNAEWKYDENGQQYFVTDEMVGVDAQHGYKKGPTVWYLTGTIKQQGRLSSKAYSGMKATTKPGTDKYHVAKGIAKVDMSEVDKDKAIFFGNACNGYFSKIVWANGTFVNEYLNQTGQAVFKYLDGVSNAIKSFCYEPTELHKAVMKNVILRGFDQIAEEKIELCPHFNDAVKSFGGSITFCPVCSDIRCLINKAMCIVMLLTIELIDLLQV